MDEALQNARDGLIPADDTPDIVAKLSDEMLKKIRYGFLEHHELDDGHLAGTMTNASGNWGDDIHALRLCELQPYELLHPNGKATIFAVLDKTRSKAMCTLLNFLN